MRQSKQWLSNYFLGVFLLLVSAMGNAESQGIELSELHNLIQTDPDKLLFIDVRDPVEIMFTGFTDTVDANVPFRLVDRTKWNNKKGVFSMPLNPSFVKEVEEQLKQKGLGKDALIVTMCRSGSARGKPSAEYLKRHGFSDARYLVNGFQGAAIKKGELKGLRVQNGWQNSGMPWQKKANPEKIYRVK